MKYGEMSSNGLVVRRRDKRAWFVMLGVFVSVFLFSFLTQRFRNNEEATAVSLTGFDPGYIISDYQMGNYNSMSEEEIQGFLTAKNPCSNRDYNLYGSLSGATWHWEDGHFVCLSEERFGDGEVIGSGETAAHIIWQTAQDYKINPQVLLVLLQKETGLITDPIPNNLDYRKATGYGCPDTAACSSKYYGFKNQLQNAAALFRAVLDGGWTNYPLGNNYVQYNPNAACGGSVVNIRSLATSALYRYTPYQPNAGALAAGYGTAYCGAYGNRNFYLYFEDWFGGITKDKYPSLASVMNNNRVEKVESDLDMSYRTNIEHFGWLDYAGAGEMAGTSGYALKIKSVEIKLNSEVVGLEYRVHMQNVGWLDYVKDGEMSGLPEDDLQVEALQIRLVDEVAKNYDVYYRVHVQDYGWMDWVKNDEIAGTVGKSLRVEAIQIKMVKKIVITDLGLNFEAHVQDYGWMDWVKNGEMAGTTGQLKRIEAIIIKMDDELVKQYDFSYRVHVQDIGWMDWVKNDIITGTTGQSKRIEAIEIRIDDELAKKFDFSYRVHIQDIGWMDWVKNGEMAGTTGQSKRMEAIEIKAVAK